MKVFAKILIIIFFLDFIITSTIIKKFEFWQSDIMEEKYWRIQSDLYHHDLLPNIDVIESWGFNLEKRLITNSLGFRDYSKKIIKKKTEKKRILLIGDSFIEGAGYDYEYTVGGLLQNYLGDDYEILNSAVSSYSPSIYYHKIKYFLDEGFKFDKALVFLDVSDIYDELFIKVDNNGNIIPPSKKIETNNFKKKIYQLGSFLKTNTITFRFLYLISDQTEVYKNYFKLKYKASKSMKKNFFDTNKEDVMFYRMTHVDRGFWTFDDEKYNFVKKGLEQSEEYLKKLFTLFDENSIDSYLIFYPWPTQINFGDEKHLVFWTEFAKNNDIKFLSLYESFSTKNINKRRFILDNFIFGDIHWNKEGNKKVFNQVLNLF